MVGRELPPRPPSSRSTDGYLAHDDLQTSHAAPATSRRGITLSGGGDPGERAEPPFWRRSLPLDDTDRTARIWVICALLPVQRYAAPMPGRADERAFSSGLCR